MSVTFSFPNSPRIEIRYEDEHEPSGFWTNYEDVWPSANFSNTNATNVIRMLDLEWDHGSGSLLAEEAPKVLRMAIKARNLGSARASAVIAPTEDVGGDGPRFFECGVTDASVVRRLDQMIRLLKFAVDNKERLTWG